jgi:16S rRNA (cytosine967-C5)-methyltransferase
MIAPARRVALEALASVAAGHELPDALARSRDRLPDERDRALAAAIVIGTLRWRARLDHHLAQAAARPLERLDPVVLEILRLSLFQLLFLERVPASAVVDDAVSMARRAGKSSAGGFVNAVLRALSRARGSLVVPAAPLAIASAEDRARAIEALHVGGSHPRWLVARWIDRLGIEAASAWVAFDNAEPLMTLRVNRRRHTREALARMLHEHGVETTPARFAPDALVVVAGNPLRGHDAASGDFLVQDEASQLVPLMLGVGPGHRVLDACAAPGGKTLVLADHLDGRGVLIAADARLRRVGLLRALLRAHDAAVPIVVHDLERAVPFAAAFDRVLLDAPCTGLGTLRRDVDIRWRRQEGDIAAAAARQRRMLAVAAGAVAPGGRLVYATCSSEPEENEEVVAAFLADTPGFRRAGPATLTAEGAPASLLHPATGDLHTRPDRDGLECFFASALYRGK